ncbi:tetratricopeptide repeat protein [Plantactinospora sp. S1510]|uniref:Tetratricopeptide repeat protein n=1 Tax=Plantactinospora alkalitolerans TaxID=2789879 RepID=A0ABS0GRM5_9ACTN|nr:tetratricopeptide repeat protein [Plantactinospora alkalitolerans]MBF9128853.1 tetratricopeptide repeat protein [Plantactinospora alkalitolerans]
MTIAGRTAIIQFVDELKVLRRRAGEPSLNRVVFLTANLPHPLPRSTISDKLNVRSLPDWEFVASFVNACAAHADRAGAPLPAEAVDLSEWSTRHVRMLRAVEGALAADRLAARARTEIDRHAPGPVVPRQLPAAPQQFAGRTAELAALDRTALAAVAPGGTGVVSAISGTAGIGKTMLALHWARRAAGRFPDGHLHVNLCGYGPGAPLTPAEAMRGFLAAFAVPPSEIPTTLDGQIGLYRSLLAGKRMLVVLDNARNAEQVRPLLPSSAGCLALVTSRDRLASLIAVEGAHPLRLDLLTPAESRSMLADRVGPDRVRAEPEAVDRIIAACTGLPLVLAIVAARAATHPGFPLADLAGELTGARGLDAFAGGDQAVDARRVFSWSFRGLDPPAARLFRLLAKHPGPDIGTAAAASLAEVSAREARRLLRDLTDAHLLAEHRPGRFVCDDLLRVYAAELTEELDSAEDQRAATHRMLDHYLRTADRAARLVDPYRAVLEPPEPSAGASPEEVADTVQALTWFNAEHRVLLAVVAQEDAGFDLYTHRLARTLSTYLYQAGKWPDWVLVEEAALRAAQRSGDRREQAVAHRGLARVHLRLDRGETALAHLRLALDRYAELGDRIGQAHTQLSLAEVFDQSGQHQMVLRHSRLALDGYRAADHPAGQARALNSIGWSLSQLGQHQEAVGYCREALDLHLGLSDRNGAAYNQPEEGVTLGHLGDVLADAGDLDAARDTWRRAAELLDRAGRAGQLATVQVKQDRVDPVEQDRVDPRLSVELV